MSIMSSVFHWFALSFVILTVLFVLGLATYVTWRTPPAQDWKPDGSEKTPPWPY